MRYMSTSSNSSTGLLAKHTSRSEFGFIPREWLGKLGQNKIVNKGLDAAEGYLDNQKKEIVNASKNPGTYRRALLQKLAGKAAEPLTNSQAARYFTNDLDELVQQGDTPMTRAEYLQFVLDKTLRRGLNPGEVAKGKIPLADVTKDAPPVKQAKDLIGTPQEVVKKTRAAKAKKASNKAAKGTVDRTVENIEGDSVGDVLNPENYLDNLVEGGLDTFSKNYNYAYFGIGNIVDSVAPEILVGGTAGAGQGLAYVGAQAAAGEDITPEQAARETAYNVAAGLGAIGGGALMGRVIINRMLKKGVI